MGRPPRRIHSPPTRPNVKSLPTNPAELSATLVKAGADPVVHVVEEAPSECRPALEAALKEYFSKPVDDRGSLSEAVAQHIRGLQADPATSDEAEQLREWHNLPWVRPKLDAIDSAARAAGRFVKIRSLPDVPGIEVDEEDRDRTTGHETRESQAVVDSGKRTSSTFAIDWPLVVFGFFGVVILLKIVQVLLSIYGVLRQLVCGVSRLLTKRAETACNQSSHSGAFTAPLAELSISEANTGGARGQRGDGGCQPAEMHAFQTSLLADAGNSITSTRPVKSHPAQSRGQGLLTQVWGLCACLSRPSWRNGSWGSPYRPTLLLGGWSRVPASATAAAPPGAPPSEDPPAFEAAARVGPVEVKRDAPAVGHPHSVVGEACCTDARLIAAGLTAVGVVDDTPAVLVPAAAAPDENGGVDLGDRTQGRRLLPSATTPRGIAGTATLAPDRLAIGIVCEGDLAKAGTTPTGALVKSGADNAPAETPTDVAG